MIRHYKHQRKVVEDLNTMIVKQRKMLQCLQKKLNPKAQGISPRIVIDLPEVDEVSSSSKMTFEQDINKYTFNENSGARDEIDAIKYHGEIPIGDSLLTGHIPSECSVSNSSLDRIMSKSKILVNS